LPAAGSKLARFLGAVTLSIQLVPYLKGAIAETCAMARQSLRRTASLFILMTVVVGSGPPYAQRHDADEFASLRGEVSQLYGEGKYTEAIPLAERYVAIARQRHGSGHPEFETAMGWLASVYYAQAVKCLGAQTRIGELAPIPHSP
jgi:hypothetical protein